MKRCLVCGKEIDSFSENSSHRLFLNHIRKEHNLSHERYIIKYELNNIPPTCACGCGNIPKFNKGNFGKYYKNHKDHMPNSKESIQKGIDTKKRKFLKLENRIKRLGTSKKELKNLYNDFINFKINLREISRETGIDKRIIKKYWYELNFIEDKEQFNRITRKHQTYWFNNVVIPTPEEIIKIDNLLPDIFNFLTKNRHTLREVKSTFDLKCTFGYLHKILKDTYGDDIDKFIKLHNASNIEIEFFNILKFYFKGVKRQYKLENKTYDYILKNKILIELDGTYWHNNEEAKKNDKFKDELAISNGFIIIRIKDTECKDINILNKIKKIYDKFK